MDRGDHPTCGRCSSSRSPSTSSARWAGAARGGQGDGRPADRRCSARPAARCSAARSAQALGGLAGEVLSATDIGLPARPDRQGRAGARQRRGVRRGARRHRGRRAALPRAARGRPPAAVRRTCRGCASTSSRRSRTTAAASTIDIVRDRGADARHRPDQPGGDPGGARGRAVRARADPGAEGRAGPARDDARAGRGLGRRGRRPGHRRAGCRPPPSCRRRSAAAAPPADRPRRRSPRSSASSCGRAGCATPRRCGARCAPARAPRPATPSGRTPTCCRPPPTSTTRWASGRTRWRPASCPRTDFDAGLRELLDGRRASGTRPDRVSAARRRARATLSGLGRARRRAGARCATRYVAHLEAHADGLAEACFPDHLTAGALVLSADRGAGAAQPAPQGRRWFHLGGHCEPADTYPGRRRALREAARSPGSPAWSLDPEPLHLDAHAVAFCDPRGTGPPPRRTLPRRRRAGRRARGQRGVARRALVAGRRAADRRRRHATRSIAGVARAARRRRRSIGRVLVDARRRGSSRPRPRTSPRGSPWPARPGVAVHPGPERRRVARLDQVGQLVHQHVVDHPGGIPCSRSKPDRAVAGVQRAPAAVLVVDPAHRARHRLAVEVAVVQLGGARDAGRSSVGRRRCSDRSRRASIVGDPLASSRSRERGRDEHTTLSSSR